MALGVAASGFLAAIIRDTAVPASGTRCIGGGGSCGACGRLGCRKSMAPRRVVGRDSPRGLLTSLFAGPRRRRFPHCGTPAAKKYSRTVFLAWRTWRTWRTWCGCVLRLNWSTFRGDYAACGCSLACDLYRRWASMWR
jgi:hypothetical protein